jgi:hypothetical protein
MKKFISLKDSLFNAFANSKFCDPQEKRFMWAILEGLRRLDRLTLPMRKVVARYDQKAFAIARLRLAALILLKPLVNRLPTLPLRNYAQLAWP